MKNPKFSHKTPHLKGKQHQLDPNLDLKQLVHHAAVQYVDRDADGDVDVYDNPKKDTPDENPKNINVGALSKKLLAKQKGELKHTRRGMAYEGNLHKWFKSSSSKDGKPGWVNVVTGGTCASDEPGEGTPKCVSSAKRASMTKAERLSAARRKKAEDPGQQQKTGAAKPTYVSTDKPERKMNEAKEEKRYCQVCQKMETRNECSYGPEVWDKMTVKNFQEATKQKDHEYSMARSELSTVINAAKRLKKKMNKGEGNIEAWVQSKITKAADYLDSAADYVDSGEMSEESDVKGKGSGKKDACYSKVKSRYSVWPSAYASGALVKCRKVGAANWGNKSEQFSNWREEIKEAGDYWHPDPEQDRKLSNRGAKLRAREDQESKKSSPISDKRKLRPGESYLEYSKRVSGEKKRPDPERKRDRVKLALGKAIDRVAGLKSEEVEIQDVYGNTFAIVQDLIKPEPLVSENSDKICPTCGKSPCECDKKPPMGGSSAKPGPNKNYVKPMAESVRIPAKTGNIIMTILNWRGKYYTIKMFFPQTTKPNRQEVQDQIEKVYPGGKVQSYYVSDIKPGEQFLQVEDWQKVNRQDKTAGLSKAAVSAYRRENPGSKLQTAVTEKNPEGKRAKRRASFCRRMKGMKDKLTSAETARDPDSNINKALRRWNCN